MTRREAAVVRPRQARTSAKPAAAKASAAAALLAALADDDPGTAADALTAGDAAP